jgi:acetolactate synthase I/II/III large subunit
LSESGHGGLAVARALEALDVDRIFALSGGHIFPIFDGCKSAGIDIVDVRHEQSAGYAAEGWARLTRSLGVACVTAGPGVTNVVSALAQASFNDAPTLVLGGRAPSFRWGQGSLQEIDHVPFIDPIALARTVTDTAEITREVVAAGAHALSPPRGPAFLDFPLDVLFNEAEFEWPDGPQLDVPAADEATVAVAASLLEGSQRPVVIAGSNVWLDRAEGQLIALAEKLRVPVFMNGQGRGCLPADHELAFARSRSNALGDADVVLVAGTPIDFRLGFGGSFAAGAEVIHLDSHTDSLSEHATPAVAIGAPLDLTFDALRAALDGPADTKVWLDSLREVEEAKSQAAEGELRSDAAPIHPLRIYGELVPLLDRDAIVIGDGGDFVSYAGREIPSYVGGCWLDPGPFGCLGCGPGYAMAARLAHPDRQVVLLYGDGALGFSGMELESLVRHSLPVTCIVGNNGIWGLEKHPMKAIYGYDVAADLRPGIAYEKIMEAFGGRGEVVKDPDEIGPALRRALDSGEPYLVNVLTDPEIAYPRSANLA